MPIDQALPDEAPYGVADWTDFEDNWREKDAEWLQGLGVPRFTTTAERDAKLTAPATGRLVYNGQTGYLQLRGVSAWADYKPLPVYLAAITDTSAQVLLAHTGAAGKGVSFTPTNVHVNHDLLVLTTVLSVTATGMSLKTGTKTAKLTTDATSLVSDSPITAPGFSSTSGGTVTGTLTVGTLSATAATIANITLSGTLSGGVVNGASGLIGGVTLDGNFAQANLGYVCQNGYFYGTPSSALLRQRTPGTGVPGTAYVEVSSAAVKFIGGDTSVENQMKVMGGRSVLWYRANGTQIGNISPVVYSATDPGAANFPDGTLWIS